MAKLMKFKVKVYWRHIMADMAEVEVEVEGEAKNGKQLKALAMKAREKALTMVSPPSEKGRYEDKVEWRDGEVLNGEYVPGAVTDDKGKRLLEDPDLSPFGEAREMPRKRR